MKITQKFVKNGWLQFHQCRCIYAQSRLYSPIMVPMPALSPTMEEGTVLKWLMPEGEKVDIGDGLCEVETDKAIVTVESVDEGTLAKILIPEGTKNVKINVPIAVLAEEGESLSLINELSVSNTSKLKIDDIEEVSSQHSILSNAAKQVLPSVRQYLHHYDIDIRNVIGSGPKGRIVKGDVLEFIKKNKLNPINLLEVQSLDKTKIASSLEENAGSTTITKQSVDKSDSMDSIQSQTKEKQLPKHSAVMNNKAKIAHVDNDITNIRNIIANRLCESKQVIPHTYSSVECSMGKVLNLRKDFQQKGIKLSVNDFVIKAAAVALQDEPIVNSIWKNNEVLPQSDSDISVAVATDTGLITPIIKQAHRKGLSQISKETKSLAEKARNGKLSPEEFIGGTFTISNLGMFGISHFTAIINPPQTSILAIGGTKLKFSHFLNSDDSGLDNNPEPVITVTLSSDARVVDSQVASTFLSKFKSKIENPRNLGLV